MNEDVRALFSKINQDDLPYQVFEPPPVAELAEPATPEASLPEADPTAFLSAYDPTPEPPATGDGQVRLKELFARLAARGRGEGR